MQHVAVDNRLTAEQLAALAPGESMAIEPGRGPQRPLHRRALRLRLTADIRKPRHSSGTVVGSRAACTVVLLAQPVVLIFTFQRGHEHLPEAAPCGYGPSVSERLNGRSPTGVARARSPSGVTVSKRASAVALTVAFLALSGCGGISEDDAFSNVEKRAVTGEVASLTDEELRGNLAEICDDYMTSYEDATRDTLMGRPIRPPSPEEIYDLALIIENAVTVRCPEK